MSSAPRAVRPHRCSCSVGAERRNGSDFYTAKCATWQMDPIMSTDKVIAIKDSVVLTSRRLPCIELRRTSTQAVNRFLVRVMLSCYMMRGAHFSDVVPHTSWRGPRESDVEDAHRVGSRACSECGFQSLDGRCR